MILMGDISCISFKTVSFESKVSNPKLGEPLMNTEVAWEYREYSEEWDLCEFEVKSDGTWGQMILEAPIARIENYGMHYRLFNPTTGQVLGRFPTLEAAKNRGHFLSRRYDLAL